MNKSDLESFSQCMLGIGETYDKKISPQIIQTYWSVLESFSIDEIKTAFHKHLQNTENGQFFPKPADIIRCIRGNSEGRALKAWTDVDYAIRTIGPYQDMVFDDPLIHATINDMGGWISLCKVHFDEYPFKANEFKTRYRSMQNIPPTIYPAKLIGIASAHNRQIYNQTRGIGYEVKPTFLGAVEKCQKVLDCGTSKPTRQITRDGSSSPERVGNLISFKTKNGES